MITKNETALTAMETAQLELAIAMIALINLTDKIKASLYEKVI